METLLRSAVLQWLQADPALVPLLNGIYEEAPSTSSLPWLQLSASSATDWSTKDCTGREVRLALELHTRGDDPLQPGSIITAIEQRLALLPRHPAPIDHPQLTVISAIFLRSRAEQRPGNRRAVLLEYRFRLIAS